MSLLILLSLAQAITGIVQTQERNEQQRHGVFIFSWRRPIFPESCPPSIVGAAGLSYRVRNGNGRVPRAKTTRKSESKDTTLRAHTYCCTWTTTHRYDRETGSNTREHTTIQHSSKTTESSQRRRAGKERSSPRPIRNRFAERVAALTRAACQRGRLPQALPD